MGIYKVRMYKCDTVECKAEVIDAIDRMPKGWGFRHITYRAGEHVQVLETHSYAMYLLCSTCIENEVTRVSEF